MRHSVCRSVVKLAPRRRGPAAIPRGPVPAQARNLPMESLAVATDHARRSQDLGAEHRTVVELARRPVSLVEIGAALAVPMAVTRVLVCDLAARGLLDVHVPPVFPGGSPSAAVLARLLRGLRSG